VCWYAFMYMYIEFASVYVHIYVYVHRVCLGVCVYICEYKHRGYMCMCIFTYMTLRLDVGVYIGRVGTQSLHMGVPLVAYIHTEFTCGCK